MPISALMYVCGDRWTRTLLARQAKLRSSRLAPANVCFMRSTIFGNNCLRIEMTTGRTADEKINRLLQLLPPNVQTTADQASRKASITISIACLAVRKELRVNLRPSTLKNIVERRVRLEVLIFSMEEAKAYRANLTIPHLNRIAPN
jgi:hypothetical protein